MSSNVLYLFFKNYQNLKFDLKLPFANLEGIVPLGSSERPSAFFSASLLSKTVVNFCCDSLGLLESTLCINPVLHFFVFRSGWNGDLTHFSSAWKKSWRNICMMCKKKLNSEQQTIKSVWRTVLRDVLKRFLSVLKRILHVLVSRFLKSNPNNMNFLTFQIRFLGVKNVNKRFHLIKLNFLKIFLSTSSPSI
ncbi:hypothetical protein BpHYR1_019968 [Brachionus plicatilis]|uniref:Uncharacterized protein n=1 Tax=Brachionus plicatilis TaxID=10195 RepID=A0A3M7PR84_BRAPC|nr:hypothetical protein BpHYR1_019968 [Brachionus plicatilis]